MDPGPVWMCIQDILLANAVLCLLPCEAPAQYYATLPRAEQAHTCPHHHVDVSQQGPMQEPDLVGDASACPAVRRGISRVWGAR